MGWLANRTITRLQSQLHEMELRLKAADERLAAERAVNSQLDKCLDEAMEVIAASDDTLTKQHAVIATLTERLTSYQQLFDDKVKPLCRETLALCGGRQEQQGFID